MTKVKEGVILWQETLGNFEAGSYVLSFDKSICCG